MENLKQPSELHFMELLSFILVSEFLCMACQTTSQMYFFLLIIIFFNFYKKDISYINPSDPTINIIGERIAKNQENPIRKFFTRITMPWNYVLLGVVALCAATFLFK